MWALSFEKYQQNRYKSLQTSSPTFINKKWVSKMPRIDIKSIYITKWNPTFLRYFTHKLIQISNGLLHSFGLKYCLISFVVSMFLFFPTANISGCYFASNLFDPIQFSENRSSLFQSAPLQPIFQTRMCLAYSQ